MAGTTWPSLTAGKKAKASEVEAKFDWLEGDIVPQTGGSQTDSVYYLGTAGARWLGVYTKSINPTSTADGLAIGTTTAHASTLLDISGTKALRIPRLSTAQITALTAADGMLVYNTTTSQLQVCKSGVFQNLGGTVFQTKARIRGTITAASTVTALNITSGGGRLVSVFAVNDTISSTPVQISIMLDGVTSTFYASNANTGVTNASAVVVTAGGGVKHFDASGAWFRDTASTYWNSTSTAPVFPGEENIGLDFASTCAVYIRGNATNAWIYYVTYQQIV